MKFTENLVSLNISSDSTIFNSFTLFITIVILLIIHPSIWLINGWASNIKYEGKCSWFTKLVKFCANKAFILMTFQVYIRIALESNQFLLISAINEVAQFNVSNSFRIASLIVAILVLILSVALILAVGLLSFSSYEVIEGKHNKIGEFFNGVKTGRSKYYLLQWSSLTSNCIHLIMDNIDRFRHYSHISDKNLYCSILMQLFLFNKLKY